MRFEGDSLRLEWKGGIRAVQLLERRKRLLDASDPWEPILGILPPTRVTNSLAIYGQDAPSHVYRPRILVDE